MTVGYVVLLPSLDRADSPPIGLPGHQKEAKRNQQLTFSVSTSPYCKLDESSDYFFLLDYISS